MSVTPSRQFFWLLGQALDCLLLPPILILLAIFATGGLVAAYPAEKVTLALERSSGMAIHCAYPLISFVHLGSCFGRYSF